MAWASATAAAEPLFSGGECFARRVAWAMYRPVRVEASALLAAFSSRRAALLKKS
jgi:hypothetical protein